jgi:hypothetical protein
MNQAVKPKQTEQTEAERKNIVVEYFTSEES